MRHGLSVWGNLALLNGVLITKFAKLAVFYLFKIK